MMRPCGTERYARMGFAPDALVERGAGASQHVEELVMSNDARTASGKCLADALENLDIPPARVSSVAAKRPPIEPPITSALRTALTATPSGVHATIADS